MPRVPLHHHADFDNGGPIRASNPAPVIENTYITNITQGTTAPLPFQTPPSVLPGTLLSAANPGGSCSVGTITVGPGEYVYVLSAALDVTNALGANVTDMNLGTCGDDFGALATILRNPGTNGSVDWTSPFLGGPSSISPTWGGTFGPGAMTSPFIGVFRTDSGVFYGYYHNSGSTPLGISLFYTHFAAGVDRPEYTMSARLFVSADDPATVWANGQAFYTGSVTPVPAPGQRVGPELVLTGDGSTTTFTTNYDYAPGGLTVVVGNLLEVVTETDPTAGDVTLPFAPATGVEVWTTYITRYGTATGATNAAPSAALRRTPPALLGSGTADSTTVLHGDGTWSAVTASGTLDWFVVTDPAYGAVGDGTTDDTTAIAAAITAASVAGGVVYFPGGTYKITSSLTITAAHVHLLGAGNEYGPSIIHMTSANTTAINYSSAWADDSWTYHASVRGLLIIGPATSGSPATSGRGIYARSHINIENVGIVGFYDGLYWDSRTYYSRAYGLFVSSCTHAGVVMVDTNNCTIDTCRIFGDDARTAPTVAGRRIFGPMQYGIMVSRSGDDGKVNRIVHSSIEYFTLDGLYADGSLALEIVGNYWEENGQSSSGHAHINLGPNTIACDATLITGNHFNGFGTSGFDAIKSDKAADVFLTANDFGSYQAIRVNFAGATTGVIEGANYFNPTPSPASVWPSDTIHLGDGASGTAGGDLSGTYPDPTVAKVNGVAVSGTPATGDVLTATGATAATWQTAAPSSSGSDHEHMVDVFAGDGSTTAFELTDEPLNPEEVVAFVAGAESAVTLSGTMNTTATFGAAPSAAARIVIEYPAYAA